MVYKYKAVDSKGQIVSARIDAHSNEECVAKLKSMGYRPINIELDLEKSKEIKLFKPKFNYRELSVMCLQFSIMIKSGVALTEILKMLIGQEKNQKKKNVFSNIYRALSGGKTLYNSFEEEKIFPNLMVNMIAVGESSSTLENCFENLSKHYESEDRFAKKVKAALIYPAILLLVSVLIVNFLIFNVMPTFVEIFTSAEIDLPRSTQILMSFFMFMDRNWMWVWTFGVVLVVGAFIYINSERGKFKKDKWAFKLPLYRRFNDKVINKRFSGIMSILLDSGMDIISALTTAGKTINNSYVNLKLQEAIVDLERGEDLSTSLDKGHIFSPMLISLIKVGEESSALGEVFNNAESYYSYEMESASAKFISLIEPLLIIIMAIFIGYIVISLASPMFEMVNRV